MTVQGEETSLWRYAGFYDAAVTDPDGSPVSLV